MKNHFRGASFGSHHTLASHKLEALNGFYEACGYKTESAGGAVWFSAGAFSMMSTPSVVIPNLEAQAVRQILSRTGKWAAVYRSEEPGELTVPLYTIRDKNYDLAHLQRQFRQQVRSASLTLQARECSWEEWQHEGLRCDFETLRRRGNASPKSFELLTPEGRERIASKAVLVPSLKIHACFEKKGMVAYLVHLEIGDVSEGLLAHRCDASHESPSRFASHLLYFTFAKAALAMPDITAVSVGRQSVPANEPLARFKRHAGFDVEPCHLRVRLHPLLAPILENQLAATLFRKIRVALSKKIPALTNLEVLELAALRSRG